MIKATTDTLLGVSYKISLNPHKNGVRQSLSPLYKWDSELMDLNTTALKKVSGSTEKITPYAK